MSTVKVNQLKLLAIFAAVIEQGSFAAAARSLGSSRSRISEQVSLLEEDLGVRLVQRTTRQLSLTEEGRQVFEQARQLGGILSRVEEATDQSVLKGRVSLTATHDMGVGVLQPVLQSYQAAYPEVELEVILSDDRLDLVTEGIDLALRIGLPRDEGLIARVLHEDRFGLYAAPAYIAEHGMPETVEDLKQHRCVMLRQAAVNGGYTFTRNGQSLQIKPQHRIWVNSTLLMQSMVRAGMGIGSILPSTLRAEVARGDLIPVLPELEGLALVFALVYPSRRQLPLRVRHLIDHIVASKVFQGATGV